jgi:hypothetical protein
MQLHEPVRDGLSTFASQNERADSDNCDDDDEQGERPGFHESHRSKAILNPR